MPEAKPTADQPKKETKSKTNGDAGEGSTSATKDDGVNGDAKSQEETEEEEEKQPTSTSETDEVAKKPAGRGRKRKL